MKSKGTHQLQQAGRVAQEKKGLIVLFQCNPKGKTIRHQRLK